MRTPLVAASVFKRNSSWTKGEGPNYSKNLIAIGAATAVGVMISTVSMSRVQINFVNDCMEEGMLFIGDQFIIEI